VCGGFGLWSSFRGPLTELPVIFCVSSGGECSFVNSFSVGFLFWGSPGPYLHFREVDHLNHSYIDGYLDGVVHEGSVTELLISVFRAPRVIWSAYTHLAFLGVFASTEATSSFECTVSAISL
jgi:hypothetical protein